MNEENLKILFKNKDALKSNKAIDFFNKAYFWDCFQDKVLLDEDFVLVIQRVLSRSSDFDDLKILSDIYNIEAIIYVIKTETNQIFGNERIERISKHFNLEIKNNFNRYIL